MEAGEVTFDVKITGTAGVILLGNIPADDMNEQTDMFRPKFGSRDIKRTYRPGKYCSGQESIAKQKTKL